MLTIPQLFRSCSQAATGFLTIASIAAVGAAASKPRYDRLRIPQPSQPVREPGRIHAHSFHNAALEASNYARPIVEPSSTQNLFSRLVFYELSL